MIAMQDPSDQSAPAPRLVLRSISGAAFVGLLIRLWAAWQPTAELAGRLTADDAYYYFRIAQNLAAGRGASFDGISSTNGFHPLYALLLVPVFRWAGDDLELGVHLALTLNALLGTAAAWPIYLAGREARSARTGAIAALLYLLNPWMLVVSLTGLESSTYVLCFASAVRAHLAWRRRPTLKRALGTGAAVGLATLARSEGGLLLTGVVADVLMQSRSQRKRAARAVLALGLASGAVWLPWAAWSVQGFGTPLPVSGPAISLQTHDDRPEPAQQLRWFALRTAAFAARYVRGIATLSYPAVLALAAAALAALATGRAQRLFETLRAMRAVAFLLPPLALIVLYYSAVLWRVQLWYFAALILVATLLAAPVIDAALDRLAPAARRRTLGAALAIATLLALGVLASVWRRGLYLEMEQDKRYLAGRWLAQNDVGGKVLAASHNGLLGYYCRCTMVNLEGVVNNAVYELYRRHGATDRVAGAYLAGQGIEFVVLPRARGETLNWGPVRLARAVEIGGTGYALYRVEPLEGR